MKTVKELEGFLTHVEASSKVTGKDKAMLKAWRVIFTYSGDTRSRFPVISVHFLFKKRLGRCKINTSF